MTKWLPIASIPGTAVIGTLGLGLAYLLWKHRYAERLLFLGNALSAGVLLSGGLVHLLHDASEALDDKFPVSFTLAGVSLLTVMGIEALGIYIMEKRGGFTEVEIPLLDLPSAGEEGNVFSQPPHLRPDDLDLGSEQSPTVSEKSPVLGPVKRSNSQPVRQRVKRSPHPQRAVSDGALDNKRSKKSKDLKSRTAGRLLTVLIFLGCLSVHAIVAGLSLGADGDLSIFVAILAHKGLAAFALGSVFVQSGVLGCLYVGLTQIFLWSTPIGITIGLIVSDTVDSERWGGILQSLAAGTFLYISLVELGPKMTHPTRVPLSHLQHKALAISCCNRRRKGCCSPSLRSSVITPDEEEEERRGYGSAIQSVALADGTIDHLDVSHASTAITIDVPAPVDLDVSLNKGDGALSPSPRDSSLLLPKSHGVTEGYEEKREEGLVRQEEGGKKGSGHGHSHGGGHGHDHGDGHNHLLIPVWEFAFAWFLFMAGFAAMSSLAAWT